MRAFFSPASWRRVAVLIVAGAALLLPGPVAAATVNYSDSNFFDADWMTPLVVYYTQTGSAITANYVASGGNSGSFRDVRNVIAPQTTAYSQVYAFHIYKNSGNAYDPVASGPVNSLTFSIDYNCGATVGPCNSGGTQAFGPAVMQWDQATSSWKYYYSTQSAVGATGAWHHRSPVTLVAGDFKQVDASGAVLSNTPNFTTGGRMFFGFFTANSTPGSAGYSVEEGYDNWQVALLTSPSPAPVLGQLKICKIGGAGIATGANFTFTFSPSYPAVQVPAGPSTATPPGYCALGPTPPVGTQLLVTETLPAGGGVSVQDIAVLSPGVTWQAANKPLGTIGVTIGAGVTEVVYTNRGTGWLEICKKAPPGLSGGYTFTVNPGSSNPSSVDVLIGACSPAIQVPAGDTVIEESGPGAIVACTTLPAGQCSAITNKKVTVNVAAGNLAGQTIAIITNH